MALVYGSAGKSAFAMGDARYRDMISRIAVPMLAFLLLLPIGYFLLTNGHLLMGLAVAAFYVFSIKSLEETGLKLKKRIFHADTGAKAEQAVAEALQELPDDFYVFNDLEFPGFNIDHVVLGPNGIFLVETKSQEGNITQENDVLLRNGRKFFKNFLNQCWSQAYSLRDHMAADGLSGLSIKPILCFSRGFVEIRGPVRGVAVLNVGYLRPYILSQRGSLPPQARDQIIPLLSAALSDQAAQPSSIVPQSQTGGIVCPKCFHERTQNDDLHFSAGECPKCGVIYARVQTNSPHDSASAQAAAPRDLTSTLQALLSDQNSQHKQSPFQQIQWPVLTLKLAACALAALLLIGAYKTMQATVTSIFESQQANQAPSDSSRLQPLIQAQPGPTRLGQSADFPLTHAVAAKDIQNAIPFVFQEDRGQNVVLILSDPQSKKLILRACVRSGEKLTCMLPQGEMALLMVTGLSWGGFDKLFGKNTDTRKAKAVLNSSPEQGTIRKFRASTSLLFQHGVPNSLPETKALVDFAFKRSSNL